MSQITLCTVPHSGTTFTQKLFEANDFDVVQNHCDEWQYVRKALMAPYPLVTTLRHPFLVEESWYQRGKEIAPMIKAFDLWLEHIYSKDPYILSVDSPRRQEGLEAIAKAFEFPAVTDWKPERVVAHTFDLTLEDLNPSREVVELAERMSGVLGEWY